MQIQAFRGADRVFAFTRDPDGGNLPPSFGPWTAFKSLDLNRGQPQPGVDVESCLDDVEAHRFHITDAHGRITDRALL